MKFVLPYPGKLKAETTGFQSGHANKSLGNAHFGTGMADAMLNISDPMLPLLYQRYTPNNGGAGAPVPSTSTYVLGSKQMLRPQARKMWCAGRGGSVLAWCISTGSPQGHGTTMAWIARPWLKGKQAADSPSLTFLPISQAKGPQHDGMIQVFCASTRAALLCEDGSPVLGSYKQNCLQKQTATHVVSTKQR